MKKLIILIAITTTCHVANTLQAQAVSSPYEYEQFDTVRYAKQTRQQARELDRLADAAEKYERENRKALEQSKRQELAFAQLRHKEQRLADTKTYIREYPTYRYDIAVSQEETKAVLK